MVSVAEYLVGIEIGENGGQVGDVWCLVWWLALDLFHLTPQVLREILACVPSACTLLNIVI